MSTGKYTQEQYERFEKYLEKEEIKKQKQKDQRKQIRTKYEWLTKNLLQKELQNIISGYNWYLEKHLEGLGVNQQVDIVAETDSGSRHIYIELEGGQSRPISNVAKIWRHIAEGKINDPILLIQIFSPYFSKGSPHTRMEESIFVGVQAEKATPNIIYKCIRPEDWPRSINEISALIKRIANMI